MPDDSTHEDVPSIEEAPAAHLAGRTLGNGWRIGARIQRSDNATGGCFSFSYQAVHADGDEAFLKALDVRSAFRGPGTLVDRLGDFLSAYRFERDLLLACGTQRMSRIIRLIAHGEVIVTEARDFAEVPYLIFERADGDIRAFQAALDTFDVAWALRTIKHVTLGIEQLHGAFTAHQDLKPSNVLTQHDGMEMKLGDLGRAERRGVEGPVSELPIPGARAYAPPEQLYGGFSRTWEERRAADLYLIGSLAVQLFLGSNLTALVQIDLPAEFRTTNWNGDFASLLPYLESAHANVLDKFEERVLTLSGIPELASDLSGAVSQLTSPDPGRRGHPRDHAEHFNIYSVRRYVSLFSRLTALAEFHLRRL